MIILLSDDEHKIREYYGSGLLIMLVVILLTMFVLYPYTLLSNNIEAKGMRYILLLVLPFCTAEYLNKYNEQVLPSNNRISLLITQRYGPRILLFVFISSFWIFNG